MNNSLDLCFRMLLSEILPPSPCHPFRAISGRFRYNRFLLSFLIYHMLRNIVSLFSQKLPSTLRLPPSLNPTLNMCQLWMVTAAFSLRRYWSRISIHFGITRAAGSGAYIRGNMVSNRLLVILVTGNQVTGSSKLVRA